MSIDFRQWRHMPSPWDYNSMRLQIEAGDERVCSLPSSISPTHEANARLICASPELLAACKESLACIRIIMGTRADDAECGSLIAHLEDAIAKATGEAP